MLLNGNATFRHRNTSLLGLASVLAPHTVTSVEIDDRLKPVLSRLRLPTGLLQRVAGVLERRNWDASMSFDAAATEAGRKALAQAGVEPSQIGLLINTSVTRAHLEPSVAVGIHNGLGLPSSALNFDIANACLGFVNAMTLAGHLIDSGQIEYAMIVDGEDAGEIRHNTVARLLRPETTRADFLSEFPSLTLGAGAAAAVLGRTSDHPEGHRILGGVTRAATQHHELCIGDVDGMFTDTKELLRGGMELVVDAWKEAAGDDWQWSDMDRYILHQVSDVHTNAIVKAAKLDKSRVPLTYPRYGNVGPASIPITLADQADSLSRGDRVLCMGVGSGLNTAMTEILW